MIKQYMENEGLKFCKVRRGTKKPFEKDWVNKPLTWEEIQPHISKETNFGVLCGYGGLIVIDSDTPELKQAVEKSLPKTFRVRTGGGGTHDYYICPEAKTRIVLQRDVHYGEVQSFGQQVIAAGSIHPNGKSYEVIQDLPITSISYTELMVCIKPFMKEIQVIENKAIKEMQDYGDADINNIPITNVIIGNFKSGGKGELYGANVWHGSSTGSNLWINPSKNVAYCFRCGAGINVAKAIALNEHIISNCSDRLDTTQFIKVLEIAQQKYGLKRLEKKSQIDKASKVFTQEGQAEIFGKIQPYFYDRNGLFWLWDSDKKYWFMKDEVDMLNMIKKSTGLDVIESRKRTEILNSLKQEGRLKIPKPIEPTWIQFKDTIYDINTGNKFPASPQYFITNPISWEVSGNPLTPVMDKLFAEWAGEDNVESLHEIIAYSILPSYPIHRLFCLVGAGSNGKSCYLRILKKFVGNSNVTSTELDTLLSSRFEVTKLYKKLVAIMGETDFNEISRTSILKRLTGQDVIGFEYKNKTPFDDLNYAKIIIATNNLPATSDKTVGFYRRWMIRDFPNSFSEKVDILSTIPEEEYSNLATRSITTLHNLLERREFSNEGTIEERTKRYEDRSDPFEKFLREETIEDLNGDIPVWELIKRYNEWAKINKYREISDHMIGQIMKKKGYEQQRILKNWYENNQFINKQFRCWVGVKWN